MTRTVSVSAMNSPSLSRLAFGFSLGFLSTFWIREILETTFNQDGLAGALWGVGIGFGLLLSISLLKSWKPSQIILVILTALLGAIIGLALAIAGFAA